MNHVAKGERGYKVGDIIGIRIQIIAIRGLA
jgi:hypothetical protein